MELTDREIRNVGEGRYTRRLIWRMVSVALVALGLLILIYWLLPTALVLGWWVGVVTIIVLPSGGVVWLFWRANKAGKRFLYSSVAYWIGRY
ncbi:hypothetical protein LCGC14_0998800 [marine sediment metagenome]|uniref:Uncharacterized protein n=1 Tax=marine sediment metagenome TaxID=412755 RepID=A0A0F9QM37_9ZZZZ